MSKLGATSIILNFLLFVWKNLWKSILIQLVIDYCECEIWKLELFLGVCGE